MKQLNRVIALPVVAAIVCFINCSKAPTYQRMRTSTNSIGIVLVKLPEGDFLQGNKEFERPVRRVTVHSFWMASTEVTNHQFELFRKRVRNGKSLRNDDPVVGIDRATAISFANWLSKKEGANYRLPTDAEWEYAARGGLVQKDYPWGDTPDTKLANMDTGKATKVGSYPPNGFGIYDMAGNAAEYVANEFDGKAYFSNPKNLTNVSFVLRGGYYDSPFCQVWFRYPVGEPPLIEFAGIRLVREVDQRSKP